MEEGACEGVSWEERVLLDEGGPALEEVGYIDPPQFGRVSGATADGEAEPPIGSVEKEAFLVFAIVVECDFRAVAEDVGEAGV